MSKIYSDEHRQLQDRFDARRMADLMESGLVHDTLAPEDVGFISSRDMFFLSTVDGHGRPTVSYKGGATGFVKILDGRTLAFPCYDGNGMYYSMGNLMIAPKVGLLFIDFETPHRLRVQGSASISFDHPALQDYPEAQFIVTVAIEEIWINCPRYIHRHTKQSESKYVPKSGKPTPVPAWKRIDFVEPSLPARDQGKANAHGGPITMDEYGELLKKGEA